MAKKDMIFIGAILLLVGLVVKLWMDSSKQKKRIQELEGGSVRALPGKQKAKALPSIDDNGGDDDEEEVKPIKLKQPQKNLLSLFKDKLPKTNTELKALYKSQDGFKPISNKEFDNMLWNMKKIGVMFHEKDKYDVNYWGPDGWFDDEGMMDEEYAHKIKSLKEKDEEHDEKEEKENEK